MEQSIDNVVNFVERWINKPFACIYWKFSYYIIFEALNTKHRYQAVKVCKGISISEYMV